MRAAMPSRMTEAKAERERSTAAPASQTPTVAVRVSPLAAIRIPTMILHNDLITLVRSRNTSRARVEGTPG